MTRTLPPDDPLGPEGTVMSGPEGRAGVTAAFDERLHPRRGRGEHGGGRFTRDGGEGPEPDAHDMVGRSVAAFRAGTEYEPAAQRPAGTRMGAAKQCYANAAAAATEGHHQYVEGYALSGRIGYWVHHAWNLDGDGKAFDLTWKDAGDRYVGQPYDVMDVLDKAVERGYYDAMAPDLITLLPPDLAEPGAAPQAGAGLAAAYADPAVTALVSGPSAAFREDEPRDRAGRWTGHGGGDGGGLADVHRRLAAIPGLLGVGGQLHSPADRRLAVTVGDIGDELAEGPDGADWDYLTGKMADLADAEQDAARRGQAGDSRARALAGELGGLRGALEALAGGGALSGDTRAAVDRGLARFHAHGGVIAPPQGKATAGYFTDLLAKTGRRLRKKADKERWDHDQGVRFTRYALETRDWAPGTKVIVARDDHGGLAGALSFYERDDPDTGEHAIRVDYLGTTGTAAGAGTALARAVAAQAAARGLAVMGEPVDRGAEAFWAKMGWHPDPMNLGAMTFAGWTPAEAAEVAARGY